MPSIISACWRRANSNRLGSRGSRASNRSRRLAAPNKSLTMGCMPPGKTIVVRHATPADASPIAEIYNAHIDRADCTMDEVHWTTAGVESRLSALHQREAVLAATVDGQVLGWGAVKRYSDRTGYRTCCETSVYVTPAQTGGGIGQAVMNKLMDAAGAAGFHHVLVRIFASNQGSIRFHERNGFSTVGVLHEVGIIRDKWVDVAIMQKILEPPPLSAARTS